MITPKQIKVARILLNWSQKNLADAASLSLPTIQRMEKNGIINSTVSNAEKMKSSFEERGIKFHDDGTNAIMQMANKPQIDET